MARRSVLCRTAAAGAWVALTAGALLSPASAREPGTADPATWERVWSDEFDYTGLPDPKKWDYEEGFVRNRELQYYTRARRENARVENGVLVIEGRKEKFANPRHRAGSKSWQQSRKHADYTAASLITHNKASWLYGRVEIRAKLPHGKGVWPAIWMMGANRPQVRWPHCGEIDIMEFVGKQPDKIHANAHFARNGKHASNGGKIGAKRPFDAFHIYAIEWFPDRIDFFFDAKKYHTFPIDKAQEAGQNPFRKPQYLLINLALGGSWGGPMDDAVLPQKYLIDYVRVYRRRGAAPFFAFDNGLGRGTTTPDAQVGLLKQLGYDGISYNGTRNLPARLAACDKHGLKLFAIYVGATLKPGGPVYENGLREAIEQLKGRDTVIWLTLRGSVRDNDAQAVTAVRQVADWARGSKLRVALYPHTGFHVARLADAVRVADKVNRDNVGVTFNLCHYLKTDGDQGIDGALRKALPRLFLVSINGADRGDTRKMGWNRLIQTLDRGSFDVKSVLTTLRRLGYAGPVGLQCYAVRGDPHRNLTGSMRAWRWFTKPSASAKPPKK